MIWDPDRFLLDLFNLLLLLSLLLLNRRLKKLRLRLIEKLWLLILQSSRLSEKAGRFLTILQSLHTLIIILHRVLRRAIR